MDVIDEVSSFRTPLICNWDRPTQSRPWRPLAGQKFEASPTKLEQPSHRKSLGCKHAVVHKWLDYMIPYLLIRLNKTFKNRLTVIPLIQLIKSIDGSMPQIRVDLCWSCLNLPSSILRGPFHLQLWIPGQIIPSPFILNTPVQRNHGGWSGNFHIIGTIFLGGFSLNGWWDVKYLAICQNDGAKAWLCQEPADPWGPPWGCDNSESGDGIYLSFIIFHHQIK